MINLWNSSDQKINKKTLYTILVASLTGLADATYLTITHYMDKEFTCSVLKGCEVVLNSKYAEVYGIPISLFGVGYYLTLFLALYYFNLTNNLWLKRLFTASIIIGSLVTAYLIYLQVGVIGKICQYCAISALSTIIILVMWLAANKSHQKY